MNFKPLSCRVTKTFDHDLKVHGKDFKIISAKDSFDLKYDGDSFLDMWVAEMKKTGKIGNT